MEITACPVCGSKNIGIGTLGDGIISGLSSWKEVCRNCGYQGASLVFDSESEYKRFLEALSQQKNYDDAHIEKAPIESEDEPQKTRSVSEKKSYLVEFIIAVVLSIVFFLILFVSRYIGVDSGVFPQNDFFFLLLFLLGSYAAVLIFFFLFIVFVEMIYRTLHNQKK